jgi:hypothetical protein
LPISNQLIKLGFKQCQANHSVFIDDHGAIIIIYVDGIALFELGSKAAEATKQKLTSCFKMQDLSELKAFVGIQIVRSHNVVHIHQKESTIQIPD